MTRTFRCCRRECRGLECRFTWSAFLLALVSLVCSSNAVLDGFVNGEPVFFEIDTDAVVRAMSENFTTAFELSQFEGKTTAAHKRMISAHGTADIIAHYTSEVAIAMADASEILNASKQLYDGKADFSDLDNSWMLLMAILVLQIQFGFSLMECSVTQRRNAGLLLGKKLLLISSGTHHACRPCRLHIMRMFVHAQTVDIRVYMPTQTFECTCLRRHSCVRAYSNRRQQVR